MVVVGSACAALFLLLAADLLQGEKRSLYMILIFHSCLSFLLLVLLFPNLE